MAKYRVVVRTVYREVSEPIEASDPEAAVEKAKVLVDLDERIPPEYSEWMIIEEVYEDVEKAVVEDPPPTWKVENGQLKRWY